MEQSLHQRWLPTAPRLNLAQLIKPLENNVYVGTFGVFLGAGIATLNGRMISVGLPDLRGAMGFGFDEASWITTAYNMALMFIGPFSVFLGAMLGARRVLLYSGTIFVLCSILLPFSPSLRVMLCLQVISGLASGTFYPLTLAYALTALPVRYVIFAIGVYAMDIIGATSVGTPLVAWYTEHLSWRWIFWQSALLTPLMMLCVYLALPYPPKRQGPKPALSWRGFLYGSLGLSLIYGALDQGERLDWLNSGVIVGLLATAVFLLAMAIIRRWLSPNPMVNPIFLVNRNTAILAAALFSFRFVMLSIAFLLPAVLGITQGYRPLETGRVLLWLITPVILMGYVAARLMRRFDNRLVLATGFTIVAIGCLLNAQLTSAWAGDNFFATQIVLGFGLGMVFTALVGSIIQNSFATNALANPINILTYSSFIHCVRLFGGELGTAFMQRLVSVREQFHSNMIGLHVDSGSWLTSERLGGLAQGLFPGSAGGPDAQARAALVLGGQVKVQAYVLAYSDGYLAIALVAALAIILIAFMKPMKIIFDSDSPQAAK
ncbi:MAG TPA: MFS transporter, partial [Pyrinomonadaceae bacterium]|nr:MFS transporter [Pyrinomonadaceae bacterium]